jgi:hypothetical protein
MGVPVLLTVFFINNLTTLQVTSLCIHPTTQNHQHISLNPQIMTPKKLPGATNASTREMSSFGTATRYTKITFVRSVPCGAPFKIALSIRL